MQPTPQRRVSLVFAAILLTATAYFAVPLGACAQEALPPGTLATPGMSRDELPAPAAAGVDQVVEVRIVGNETIATSQISGNLTTRAGRPYDESLVQQDVRRLMTMGWFINVKPLYETTPQGRIVVFEVTERPTIRYIEYAGNEKITDKNLAKQTGLEPGGAVDPYAVEEGRRKIRDHYIGRGFNNVQVTIVEGSKETDRGVIYLIHEGVAQKIWSVAFEGNQFLSDARLKTKIKSKPPILKLFKGFVDREQIEADEDRLESFYRSYGYFGTRVSAYPKYNDKGNWVNLTFVINEGPRYRVRGVRFLGNTRFQTEPLAQQAKLQVGEYYEQQQMLQDKQWLQELYGSHGYVFADVQPELVYLEEPGELDLVYHIEEGRQWRVGRIFVHIAGDNPHTRIQTALNRVTLRPGEIMDIRELKASERRLMASSLFHVDAASGTRPKITYRIPDDVDLARSTGSAARASSGVRGQSPEPDGPAVLPPPCAQQYRGFEHGLRRIRYDQAGNVHVYCDDYSHYRRWAEREGELKSTRRPPADANPRSDAGESPAKTAPAAVDEAPLVIRGQNPQPQGADTQKVWWRRPSERAQVAQVRPTAAPTGSLSNRQPQYGGQSVRATGPAATPARSYAPRHTVQRQGDPNGSQSTYAPVGQAPQVSAYSAGAPATTPYSYNIRGQSPGGVSNAAYAGLGESVQSSPQYGGQTVRATGPSSAPIATQGVQQAQYSSNINPPAGAITPTPLSPQGPLPPYTLFPDGRFGVPGQPYPEGMVDIYIDGQETQTGRLMLGVGVNSDAGVVGNIVVDERNFDWTRYPRSFEDFRNGSAWRGAGQRFRIDASPGSEVNRYLVSWQEPYLFDRPVSLGLSGSYFDRRFRNWDEQRMGGRVSLGYQWVERDLSATVSYRGENINIHDPSTSPGVVPELDEVLGDNVLHGFKLSLINDTRDSPFLATQGHYLELGGEQVIGTFDYPRVELDARQYFLLRERPDHSGRHVLSLSTNVGYSGTHTPIYDNFFAGGFSTLRGFDFRGASPVVNGVEVGGRFQWINSAQYLFPVTADDMLHGVVFCDFGTVEQDVAINDFRVAPGVGLRITVPAMGPAPIALDFAWAVNHADFDDLEVFAFSLGFSR